MFLIGKQIPREYVTRLQTAGLSFISLPADPRLPSPVASHPDMLVFVGEDRLITDQTYYTQWAKAEIDLACLHGKLSLHVRDEPAGTDYPDDMRFNAAQVGHHLFCYPAHTSPAILNYAEERKLTLIRIKQGYARCSLCPVGDHALITADHGIAKAAKKHDLDVLLIHQGHVVLPGYRYGFIGGCCGSWGHKLFFLGDPLLHPDGEAIIAFVRAHSYEPLTQSGLPLFDGGSLLVIPDGQAHHNRDKTPVSRQ